MSYHKCNPQIIRKNWGDIGMFSDDRLLFRNRLVNLHIRNFLGRVILGICLLLFPVALSKTFVMYSN